MKIHEIAHGQRNYTKMGLFIPKELVESRRWSSSTRLFLSRNSHTKFALLAARRFVDDTKTGITEQYSFKEKYGRYVSYRLTIPQRIVRELDIRKGDTADVGPFKGGVLISLPTRNI